MTTRGRTLQDLLRGHQGQLRATLENARALLDHTTMKGNASEACWRRMLEQHLPRRYRVCNGLVVDSTGAVSEQTDVIIHDAHFCPTFPQDGDSCFVPAESVYAVFDVKQELDKQTVEEAAGKAASVRRLTRTSAPIVDRGETRGPRALPDILAGVLCTATGWKGPLAEALPRVMDQHGKQEQLDLGCVLDAGSFERLRDDDGGQLLVSREDVALETFFLRLLYRLQRIGTIPAIDWSAYARALERAD